MSAVEGADTKRYMRVRADTDPWDHVMVDICKRCGCVVGSKLIHNSVCHIPEDPAMGGIR